VLASFVGFFSCLAISATMLVPAALVGLT